MNLYYINLKELYEKKKRDIPLGIKRKVRKRCGFGCVICGLPFYEYDHIIEFAQTNSHEADNLTLLCPLHHSEKTRKILTLDQIKKANDDPFNIKHNYTTPYKLHYEGATGKIRIGDLTFPIDNFVNANIKLPLVIENRAIFQVELQDQNLLFSIMLFDENDNLVFGMDKNEITVNIRQFDIEFVGQKFLIRSALHKIFIEFHFKTPNEIILSRGKIYCKGVLLEIKNNKGVIINKTQQLSNLVYGGTWIIALAIGYIREDAPVFMHISKYNRLS